MLIDSHCHLDFDVYDGWRERCVEEASKVGVKKIIVPGVCASRFLKVLSMKVYGCSVALGLHPFFISEHTSHDLDTLARFLESGSAVAMGEIGLDGTVSASDFAVQETLFVEQLRLARRYDLPVILHAYRAIDQVLKCLRRYPVLKGGIVHAFSGSEQQAKIFISMGFKLGFGGTITYEGSRRIRYLATNLPAEAIVLETDAPDMLPFGVQSPNRPANLVSIAYEMAKLRKQTLEQLATQTNLNLQSIFGQI